MCWALRLLALLLPLCAHAEPQVVYLTFDDGPRANTLDILDVLTEEQVPGTFFLIGVHVNISPHRLKTLQKLQASPWAQVANHSYTHANEQYRVFYSNPEGMLQDFTKNNTVLGFSEPPFPTRLPGRIDWRFEQFYTNDTSYPKNNIKDVHAGVAKLFDNRFILYGWDVEWMRSKKTREMEPPERVVEKVKEHFLKNRSVKPNKVVVLMHDQNLNGPEGIGRLKTLIKLLRQEGYCFDFMRNYGINTDPVEPPS
ncbi:MAG: polysaccharide deacetylase family protein [Magnetococcales bacterium]|nr:polysaccharide deacetylase family protein [Magnetococcales bacterium]